MFILGYLAGTVLYDQLAAVASPMTWLESEGVFGTAFPTASSGGVIAPSFSVTGDLVEISENFNAGGRGSPFAEAGVLLGRDVHTTRVTPEYSGDVTNLGDVLVPEDSVPVQFFLNGELDTWAFLKGPKSLARTNRSTGHTYNYSEGGIAFPDPIDRPSRTIITGEGGVAPSRFKHVVSTPSGRLRRLVPVELERLNMFPDDHTSGVPESRRAFLMGNALVTGIVQFTGYELAKRLWHADSLRNKQRTRSLTSEMQSLLVSRD